MYSCARRAGHCWLHFLLIYVICIAIATNSDLPTNTSGRTRICPTSKTKNVNHASDSPGNWKSQRCKYQYRSNLFVFIRRKKYAQPITTTNTHCCLIEEIHARPSLSTLASAVFHPLSLLFLWLLYLLLPQFLFSILVVFVADHPLNTRIVREKSK